MSAEKPAERLPRSLPPSLWHNADFLKLWAGQTVSLVGSQTTILALPLAAVLTLRATPAQVGVLVALWNAPNILSFFAGALIDRVPRKPVLIVTDLIRALLLFAIVAGARFHLLRIELLYLIVIPLGACSIFFDVSAGALLPSLISRDQLVEGNAKLQTSDAAARIVGPGLGGWLVQVLTAPVAIAFDAISYLVSVLSLILVHAGEMPMVAEERPHLMHEILVGASFVRHHALIRPMLLSSTVWNLADSIIFAVYVLYATRVLHLTPGALGLTFTVASLGFLAGSAFGPSLQGRIGIGQAIVVGGIVQGIGALLLPLAAALPIPAPLVLGGAQFVIGLGFPLVGIGMMSVRQAVTAAPMLGRVGATWHTITWGVLPFGNLAGGLLGNDLGLQRAIEIGAAGCFLACIPVLVSPVRSLHTLPATPPDL